MRARLAELDETWVVLTLDEAKLRLTPTLSWQWALEGSRPTVDTWGTQAAINLFTGVNQTSPKLNYRVFPRQNSAHFCQFLKHLLNQYPNKRLLLILDHARFHTSRQTTQFFERHRKRLEPLFLPKYSPNLNPTEQLFRWLRQDVTHNQFFETLTPLKLTVREFLAKATKAQKELKRRCSLNL